MHTDLATIAWPLLIAVIALIGWLICDGSANANASKLGKICWVLFAIGAFWTVALLAGHTGHL